MQAMYVILQNDVVYRWGFCFINPKRVALHQRPKGD